MHTPKGQQQHTASLAGTDHSSHAVQHPVTKHLGLPELKAVGWPKALPSKLFPGAAKPEFWEGWPAEASGWLPQSPDLVC